MSPGMLPPSRIIPARAGFTGTPFASTSVATDHPRSRGVYASPILPRSTTAGSSPLARGLLTAGGDRGGGGRIIPARAGFTRRKPRPRRRPPDHPRSRGVYETSRINVTWSYGSSPLARGLRYHRPDLRPDPRIIPARAGFTTRRTIVTASHQDHPRSRGVYPWVTAPGRVSRGSSPLARGLHGAGVLLARPPGIIPARAGFTDAHAGAGGEGLDHPRSRGVYHHSSSR